MTSQGSAHERFQRAIQRRNLFAAEMAAREMDRVTLANALALTLLIAEESPERYERAAMRWHARFVQEARGLSLPDARLALAALDSLSGAGRKAAAGALTQLGRTYGVNGLEGVLRSVTHVLLAAEAQATAGLDRSRADPARL
jgi:hypothetical protein